MMNKTLTSMAFAAGCALALAATPAAQAQTSPQLQPTADSPPQLVTNGPQATPGDFGDWSAQRNVAESAQYDRLLQVSPGFRQARINKECGPISDPQLQNQCMASFDQYEPAAVGSSTPPMRYRQGAGD
jgi:hypothetical protein